ncbi:MAG: RidA family protein [Lachnospiraceae bacterium]|nr:RidA family protein [Lachnospiraceae bacterium]
MKEIIATEKAPAAIGPYSQATAAHGLVFVSGQLPADPETGAFPDDIQGQTRQSLENVKSILEARGLSMANILKTTVYLQHMSDFAAMNEVYASFFEGDYPARAAFEVAALPKGALVEIEAVAAE